MGIGTSMRTVVTTIINNFGSDVVITPVTVTVGTYGGYNPATETEGTAVTESAVPYDMVNSLSFKNFGDLEVGRIKIVFKYTATIPLPTTTTKYIIEWNSETYDLISVEEYPIQDVTVAKIATLAKRLG